MSLCLRGTFIDLVDDRGEEERPRLRSSSTPASVRKSHFSNERNYIRKLAKRVGFPGDTIDHTSSRPGVRSGCSRSMGALPLMQPSDDEDSDFEDERGDQFFADFATTAACVQSLSSLPPFRTCGTAATTMDSLGSLGELPPYTASMGDLPLYSDIKCCDGKIEEDGNMPPTAESFECKHETTPSDSHDCEADERSSGSVRSMTMDSLPVIAAAGTAPTEQFRASPADEKIPATCPRMEPPNGSTPEVLRPEGIALEPTGPNVQYPTLRTAPFDGDAQEVGRAEGQFLEPTYPNMQYPLPGPSEDSRYLPRRGGGATATSRASFPSQHHGMQQTQEAWLAESSIDSRGAGAWTGEDMYEEAGVGYEQYEEEVGVGYEQYEGYCPDPPVSSPAQVNAVVSVAFKDKMALILISQNLSTLADIAILREAINTCYEQGSETSAILLWLEGDQGQCGQEAQLSQPQLELRRGVAEAVEALHGLPHPVLGFASGNFKALTTFLTVGCDQLLALSTASFCVREEGEFRQVNAKRGMELGFVGRLLPSQEGLLNACSSFMDQVIICSEEELKRMKMSLRGMRSYLMEASRTRVAPSQKPAAAPAATRGGGWFPQAPPPSGQAPAPVAPSSTVPGNASGAQQCVTSLMLRNLPCRLTPQQLANIIDLLGFAGKVDCMHFPANKGSANPGYVFINLVTPEDAALFTTAFRNYRFTNSNSLKVPDVTPARIQGRAAMIEQAERQGL